MNSFLLTGGDITARAKYLADLSASQTELIHLVAEKTTLTIKQVKDLSLPLSVDARIPRIVWIEEAGLLTIPAQNALLKMLEEPPSLTSFYLSCASPAMLLPTIRSRTQLIALDQIHYTDDPKILAEIKNIMALSPGDRLGNIVKRDRTESLLWLSQIESALKDKLHATNLTDKSAITLAKIAKLALQAHKELLANCSVGLVTQVFYLSLPKTK